MGAPEPRQCVVVTSVRADPSWVQAFTGSGFDLIVVGDEKTPDAYGDLEACTFLDLDAQGRLFPGLSDALPRNHYARKNLGYAFAMREGYDVIAETDDDNVPLASWGRLPTEPVPLVTAPAVPNVYRLYSDRHIWPRGLPLDAVRQTERPQLDGTVDPRAVAVWQGLVEADPDVDAICRLCSPDHRPGERHFSRTEPAFVALDRGVVSPGNTQNTFWVDASVWAYTYLPSTVSGRVCDILRSFVFQPGLWARGLHFGVTPPSMEQRRNEHDLLEDFREELALYLDLARVSEILAEVELAGEPGDLLRLYGRLAERGLVGPREVEVARTWLTTLAAF